jgi:hypothetical protein
MVEKIVGIPHDNGEPLYLIYSYRGVYVDIRADICDVRNRIRKMQILLLDIRIGVLFCYPHPRGYYLLSTNR